MTASASPSPDEQTSPSRRTRAGSERRALARQRRAAARLGATTARLPRHLHAVVIAIAVASTVTATLLSHRMTEARQDASFARESERVSRALLRRLSRYEDALQSGVALLDAAGGRVDDETWRRFAGGLDLDRRYPGVNGIGLIERVPAAELDAFLERRRRSRPDFAIHPRESQGDRLADPIGGVHYPIVAIEPLSENRSALGLDIAHEAERRSAARIALETGASRLTGPIQLVQNDLPRAGFLFYAPYLGGRRDASVEDAMTGLVYAPFIVEELVRGALPPDRQVVDIALHDGERTLYDGRPEGATAVQREHRASLEVYGRDWTIDVRARPAFEAATSSSQPWLVLIGGIVIDLMLVGLFIAFARVNRALEASARLSRELDERSLTLERSNRELERFACVASHDLKSPLRGIGDLVWYLREDLGDYLAGDAANPEVSQHLERLERQTGRMERLIDGIQDYSGIGRHEQPPEEVSIEQLLAELVESLDLPSGRLRIPEPLPSVWTQPVSLAQVLANLVGNAFKYHPEPDRATVTVTASVTDDTLELIVSDDGAGIEPRFHERVFEMFETLQPKDRIESTGIGLAIVKKLAEDRGGSVELDSEPGDGARFTVRWPLERRPSPSEQAMVENLAMDRAA